MMERIHKLQPNRTLCLRGFDDLGASAALHSANGDSFKVSGVFRDAADFAVLILYDADNFYEHPRLKYLPDFRFNGLTLSFDVRYRGLMPLDSPKYATIDWPYLDYVLEDGSTGRTPLFANASQNGGDYTPAESSFEIVVDGVKEFDRLTLWYLNIAYDYIVPKVECSFLISALGPGSTHTVTVAGQSYSYVEQSGDANAGVATGLVEALSSCAAVTAARGNGTAELGPSNQVNVRAAVLNGLSFDVAYRSTSHRLTGVGAATVAQALASQVNATNWTAAGALVPLTAQATGTTLRFVADRPGVDGNMLRMYSVAKNARLATTNSTAVFTGGKSDATWRVTLEFGALGLSNVRQMWLTFAPALADSSAFADTEWEAEFTNWTVSGPDDLRVLKVAGPGSVRIEENDSWCKYTGVWTDESGFFSEGFAKRASVAGASVAVNYSCPTPHDLYLGTSLYIDRGIVAIQLDGGPETTFNCALANEPAVNTRRKIRSMVAPGEHTITFRLASPGHFYFDFLEATIPSDVPEPLTPRTNVSPALDYSTDHTYKLSPARLHWIFDNLGYAGPMNEYLGVFWWNQRKREGAQFPQATVQFTGSFAAGDEVFLDIGGQECGKTVFPNESPQVLAKHFEYFINANYVGVWASAEDDILTITARSPKPAFSYTLSARVENVPGSSGAVSQSGSLSGGEPGMWVIDPDQLPALNRGARDWHADFFRECRSRNREIVVASSMELVNPPEGFGAVYPDGKIVETDVGFGSLKSTHCAFVQAVREYHSQVFLCLTDLMSAAQVTPAIQFGEYLWWFFTNHSATNTGGGMAFYHPEVTAAAQSALGRPLHRFVHPNDDPHVNAGADALFLRNRLRDHVAGILAAVRAGQPATKFELLFPYDVNHPQPAGIHQLGGALNRYVNLPVEWETKPTSGLDSIKTEALDFGAWSRNLDLARTAIELPFSLGWPKDSVRHLVPVFRSGYAWEKEMAIATSVGVETINLWAFDHVCIYGLPPVPGSSGRSQRF
jgi:hypothetical protein